MKVSKELLSEVFGVEVKQVLPDIHKNILQYVTESYGFGDGCLCEINIYELAHKCKDLAYDKGYMIDSYAYKVKIISPKYEFEHIYTINGDPKTTKPYDIWRDIEACQWILDNEAQQ